MAEERIEQKPNSPRLMTRRGLMGTLVNISGITLMLSYFGEKVFDSGKALLDTYNSKGETLQPKDTRPFLEFVKDDLYKDRWSIGRGFLGIVMSVIGYNILASGKKPPVDPNQAS